MILNNGYMLSCLCGAPDCIERTGELGSQCHQVGHLLIPNAFLAAFRSPLGEVKRHEASRAYVQWLHTLPKYRTPGFDLKESLEKFLANQPAVK